MVAPGITICILNFHLLFWINILYLKIGFRNRIYHQLDFFSMPLFVWWTYELNLHIMKTTSGISFYFQPVLELFLFMLIIPLLSSPSWNWVLPQRKSRELTTHFTVFSFLLSQFMCDYLLLRVFKYIIHAFDLGLIVVFSGRDRAQTPWTVCSLSGSFVHGILQARILEWVAIPFSGGSPQLRDWIWVSCTAGSFFTIWAPREVLVYSIYPKLEPH